MTEEEAAPTPIEVALDVFVYAPLGLLSDLGKWIPTLAEHGRQQSQQARMVGEFVVTAGRQEAEKRVTEAVGQASTALEGIGVRPAKSAKATAAPATATAATASPAAKPSAAAPAKKAPSKKAPAKKVAKKAPAAKPKKQSSAASADLAIPDYDSLAASQVVPRLASLSPAELEAVRTYESGHRARKTILNKVKQLQS